MNQKTAPVRGVVMISRMFCVCAIPLCLQGCITFTPQESKPVALSQALQIVAHDLNAAAPVVLSDLECKDQNGHDITPEECVKRKKPLKDAIKARQCAIQQADPPLPVITGPVSLALQGSIQQVDQGSGGLTFPGGTFGFQVQVTKSQQQQLTVPITFVPASALGNFFLGQNVSNFSGLPDKGLQDGADKVTFVKKLIYKAELIQKTAREQIKDFPPTDCPDPNKPSGHGFVASEMSIAVVIPETVK